MQKYDNIYHEIYALYAMNIAYPNFADDMVKSESPDWVDAENSIGLEVTRAESKHIGYTRYFVNQYLGKKEEEVPEEIRVQFRGDIIIEKGRIFSICDSKGLVDGTRHIKFAIESCEKKLARLNSRSFSLYESNELFLFLAFTIGSYDVELFASNYYIAERSFAKKFSRIVLFDNNTLYDFRPSSGTTEEHNFSEEELSILKRVSLFLRSKSDWRNGTKFSEIAQLVCN